MAEIEFEIQVEDEVLAGMKSVCKDLGITVNEALAAFAREFVAHRGFPFEVTEEELEDARRLEENHG